MPTCCERDRHLPVVLPLHPPTWQPLPCSITIIIQITSESSTDSKPTLTRRVVYTELHLVSSRSLSWGSCRDQNKVNMKHNYCLAQCVFSTGATIVPLYLGNVTTATEPHFNYEGEKNTPSPTTRNTAKAEQTWALILQRLLCTYMLNFTLSQHNYLCYFSIYNILGKQARNC